MLKICLRNFGFTFAAVLLCSIAPAHSLGNLHPSFTVQDILPEVLKPIAGISGMDLLPNGDGAICSWGGSQKSLGQVWIIPNLASGAPGTPVSIATGLREPLGLKTVGNDFYVMEKNRINKFTGSGLTWTRSTIWTMPTAWYNDGQWHHFAFNLVYKDNAFWFTTGTAYDYDQNDPLQRGALIRVPMDGSGFSQFARGLRNTNGIGIGPNDEFFATDNQGHWKPADYLYHIPTTNIPTNGRFYGFRTVTNNACGITAPPVTGTNCPTDPEYPPAIWIPYGSFSNSPTRPILIKSGPFKDQMISGDICHGGTLRYFLEKVGGEYQGAVFPMMTAGIDGVNFGINQFLYTPSGSLLVAGVGGFGNWSWNSKTIGLDLLTPTSITPFEILAVRSTPTGFDIEFTQPAGAAAGVAANYQVKTTVFTPVKSYGADASNADNNITVNVNSVTLSADGKHAVLNLASMETLRMYAITLNNIKSITGELPYNNIAYYTLNKVGSATGLQNGRVSNAPISVLIRKGEASISLPFNRPFNLGLSGLDGRRIASIAGSAPQIWSPAWGKSGLYLISGTVDGAFFREIIRKE